MRLINGKICLKHKVVTDQDLVVRDNRIFLEKSSEKIKDGDSEPIDLKGSYLLPGFVDIHTHGAGLFDFSKGRYNIQTNSFESSDKIYKEDLSGYALLRAKTGVTSLYLATVADSVEALQFCFQQLKDYVGSDRNGKEGSLIKGALLEGSFLNPEMCGAQNPEYVFKPDIKKFDLINESGMIKLVNVVPDNGEPAFKMIKALKERGVIPGAGHTNGTGDQFRTAIDNGLSYVIHFLNGPTGTSFKPFDHGGAVERILQDNRIYTELIIDGFHINPDYVRDVIARKGLDKIIAVTDSMFVSQTAGITDFKLNGISGCVSQDGKYLYVVDSEPLSLFGSVLTMDKAFSNIVSLLTRDMEGVWHREHNALDLDQAVLAAVGMCAANPCNLLKEHSPEDPETGSIEEGKWADLIAADIKGRPGEYYLDIQKVFVRGSEIYSAR
ncbi:MAG: amidohydrolase family protein [Candidatus Omnitrophica bacterium]|nr:amidohydrolase family protein [Candidatus Omnitrophota bacterium]